MVHTVRVSILGCGNVGAALVDLLRTRADAIETRTGLRLDVARVAVRDTSRQRGVSLADDVLTTDASSVVGDDSIDVVVEVIGGVEPARSLITKALESGKPVVTANKELLANAGAELFATAEQAGVDLLFGAAAAGVPPLVRPLGGSLAGARFPGVRGIVTGTPNYIPPRMTGEGVSYDEARGGARPLGNGGGVPTADVEGYDAGAK